MTLYSMLKPILLSLLFIKEQLKEPVALFWTVISPVVTYYLMVYMKMSFNMSAGDYLSRTSWFYAFVSSSVATFGLAFYIVGRRESGFLRSFVYTRSTKAIFLIGQFFAYSIISILYCSVFYVMTRGASGFMDVAEYLIIVGRFYICFLVFSIPSLLLTLIPMGFQNTSTVFSMLSLVMLALGIFSVGSSSPLPSVFSYFNPMWWANRIMLVGVFECWFVVFIVAILFLFSFFLMFRFLRINPVWSRY